MRRNVVELFTEALQDVNATPCDGKEYLGRLFLGIKITRETKTKQIRIYNTHLGGGFYKELTPDEIEYFRIFGWSLGVFHMSLKNTKHKIDTATYALRELGDSKKHAKLIEEITAHKAELQERYNSILCRKRNYINHFKNKSNGNRHNDTNVSVPNP